MGGLFEAALAPPPSICVWAALVALTTNTPACHLSHLSLRGNGLGPREAAALGDVLPFCSTLSSLSLAQNKLGDEGAAALLQGLSEASGERTRLSHLSLADNGLSSSGLGSLFSAFFGTSITLSGAQMAARGLALPPRLKALACEVESTAISAASTHPGHSCFAEGAALPCIAMVSSLAADASEGGGEGRAGGTPRGSSAHAHSLHPTPQAWGGFKRMSGFCRSRVPRALLDELEPIKDDEEAIKAAGVRIGARMCRELIAAGTRGLHFYTLNLEKVTFAIMAEMGILKAPAE